MARQYGEEMIRKPKQHPTYDIPLVGINFRERWNVVQMASKEEVERYIELETERKNNPRWNFANWSEWITTSAPLRAEQTYLRKLWRLRYGQSFKDGQLYRVDKTIHRYNQKLGLPRCNGTVSPYQVDRDRRCKLGVGSLVVLTYCDELGTLYFSRIDAITDQYSFAFSRDSSQIGSLIPIEA